MCPSDRYNATPANNNQDATAGFRPAFDALDTDRDGKIGPDDLKALSIAAEDDIRAMIAVADADRNGFVEYEEFEKVLGVRGGGGRELMEEVFGAMDRDGDGKVGFRDLREYLIEVVGMTVRDDEVSAMITMAGGGGDGGVGFEGLVRILASRP